MCVVMDKKGRHVADSFILLYPVGKDFACLSIETTFINRVKKLAVFPACQEVLVIYLQIVKLIGSNLCYMDQNHVY